MYYYVKNLQGDIVRIVDSSGTVVVNYSYNVWGKSLSVDYNSNNSSELNAVLTLNSLRYRGYVYDDETGLYYLQSRYYDPTTCRFFNADSTKHLIIQNSLFYSNLYSYCDNNPLSYVDANGECLSTIFYTLIGYIGAMTPAIISGGIFTLSNSITAQMYLLSFYNLEPYRLYNLSDNQMYVQKIKSSHEYNEFLGSISDILEGLYHQMFGDWSKWRKTGTIMDAVRIIYVYTWNLRAEKEKSY